MEAVTIQNSPETKLRRIYESRNFIPDEGKASNSPFGSEDDVSGLTDFHTDFVNVLQRKTIGAVEVKPVVDVLSSGKGKTIMRQL